jgi:2-oxoglutarate ferredoxin oxidoreductase subunit beta
MTKEIEQASAGPTRIRRGQPYCPSCIHGIAHRLIAEVIDELGIRNRPWASRLWAARCWPTTILSATLPRHPGRAPAIATGIKRARPELIVLPTRRRQIRPLEPAD